MEGNESWVLLSTPRAFMSGIKDCGPWGDEQSERERRKDDELLDIPNIGEGWGRDAVCCGVLGTFG